MQVTNNKVPSTLIHKLEVLEGLNNQIFFCPWYNINSGYLELILDTLQASRYPATKIFVQEWVIYLELESRISLNPIEVRTLCKALIKVASELISLIEAGG